MGFYFQKSFQISYIGLFIRFFVHIFIWKVLILSGDIETNPGPRRESRSSVAVLYSNIRGLKKNIRDLALSADGYDVVFCSETLASDKRSPIEILLPGFNKPILKPCVRNGNRGMALYLRSGFSAVRMARFECSCHEMFCVRVCGKYNNFYNFAIYRSPNTDDSIYDCLLEKMAIIQERDVKASFVFIGDFNAHHREWLGSSSVTDRHGLAAFQFSNVSGTSQLVDLPTHVAGNPLDLVFTDVPGVVSVSVGAPVGTSDHNSLSCNLTTSQHVPNVSASKKVYLKSRANWDAVCSDLSNATWSNIYHDPEPASRLSDLLCGVLERRVPSKTIRTRSSDKPWFNNACRQAYQAKQEAYRRYTRSGRNPNLWQAYIDLRNEASAVYSVAETSYNNHARSVLSDCSDSHKWWSTLKESLFGSDNSMPPLMTSSGAVSSSPIERSRLLSDVFKNKQCGDSLELPPACFPEASLVGFAFKSKEVLNILSDLDSYGGLDPTGVFPLFLKETRAVLAPKLSVIFRKLIRSGDFPSVWRVANVTPIPKTSTPSVFPEEYRPISITPCVSKVFERLVCSRLMRFAENKHLLPNDQFAYRKGLGTCDALLTMVGHIQAALDRGGEACAVSLDFSSAFDRINHPALIYRLQLLGVGGRFLEIIKTFLEARSQSVVVDGSRGDVVRVVSGVPQGSVLGPFLFILFTAGMWDCVENNLSAYADDATLYARIDSPNMRATVTDSLNADLANIVTWCRIWGMKLNPRKTQAIIFSRSRTVEPPFPPLLLDGEVLQVNSEMKILGVILDSKLTFEKHIRSVCSSLSSRIGILRKSLRKFNSLDIVKNCFYAFLLPVFEYCAPVWSSAADCHLALLDKTLNRIKSMIPNLNIDLGHRRSVASMCMFFKILGNPKHPLRILIPPNYVAPRLTRYNVAINSRALTPVRWFTSQYQRCFITRCVEAWNLLPGRLVELLDLQKFKLGVNAHLLRS